jgi:arylsulfatase A-like enzyme
LVDALAFGFVGLILGIIAELGHRNDLRLTSYLVAIICFVTGAYISIVAVYAVFWRWTHGIRSLSVLSYSLLGGLIAAIASVWFWPALRRYPRAAVFFPRLRWLAILFGGASLAATVLFAFVSSLIGARATLPGSTVLAGWATANQPNIIMIALDTARADHFSSYGYSRSTTSNLDNLAKKGVLFETAVATAPWTLPSFASVFTGLLPHQHAADGNVPLASGLLTLASILKSRGYSTVGFNANFVMGTRRTGIAQGFDFYEDGDDSFRSDLDSIGAFKLFLYLFYHPLVRVDPLRRRDAREVSQSVMHWFGNHSQQPFFLFINYFDAHEPYSPIREIGDEFGDAHTSLAQRVNAEIHGFSHLVADPKSAAERATVVAGYDSAIAYEDRQIGNLLRLFEASPEWSNTYIVVFADHGQSLGDHGHYGHRWGISWELLHVPLIIAGPGIPAGRRITDLVSLQQLFATILDLSQGASPAPEPKSLRCYWTFPPVTCDAQPLVVSEYSSEESISLVTPEWHFIRDFDGNEQLYHRTTDPLENVDLALSPGYQDEVKILQRRLIERLEASPPWRGEDSLRGVGESEFSLLTKRSLPGPGSGNKQPSSSEKELIHSLPYE